MAKKSRTFFSFHLENRAGIYAIVNRRNGHKYIGQAKDLSKRRAQHFGQLIRNHHNNSYLQSAFNLYGPKAFTFIVLEYLTCFVDLDKREQFWIDKLKPEYNSVLNIEEGFIRYEKRDFDVITINFNETFQRPAWHAWVYGGAKNPKI